MTLRSKYEAIRGTRALAVLRALGETTSILRDDELVADGDYDATAAALETLAALGCVHLDERYAATFASLSKEGRRLVDYATAQHKRGGPERNDAIQRSILAKLSTQADEEAVVSISDLFDSSSIEMFGGCVSEAEIEENLSKLVQLHLVDDEFMPQITPSGRTALAAAGDELLETYSRELQQGMTRDSRTFVNHISGPVGALTQGDHAAVTVSRDPSVSNIDQVRTLLVSLTALAEMQRGGELAARIAEIANEADRPVPSRTVLREKLLSAFLVTEETQLDYQVMPILKQIGALLGG